MTLKAGLRGLAARLIAYWRKVFLYVNIMMSHLLLHILTGEVRNAPKPKEVLDGEQYLRVVNRTFWQIHTQQSHSLALTELKNDTDVKV